jgi:alginate O-acetyltransferase complex protein AlgI
VDFGLSGLMLFNSAEYLLFLPTVLAIYLLLARCDLSFQNLWIIAVSYVFYGWWDWRLPVLLSVISLTNYIVGAWVAIAKRTWLRRALLCTSLFFDIGVLALFKYFNFFVTSLVDAFAVVGVQLHAPTLRLILPVGVSFYTLNIMTYTISVYQKQIQPTRNIAAFFAYVSFFPQLVAGPIERAGHLLPQFLSPRRTKAEDVINGLRQIAWGLFCKLVIADNCTVVVNAVFGKGASSPGSIIFIGALFFSFQIYGDFAGYSHIAIGSARLFGFDLMQNFATPYFSKSVAEFWRRWHISLSSWFRDYVYIPLGGNRCSKHREALNILVTFTLSGLWHGANLTFIAWGLLNGLYILPRIVFGEPLGRLAAVSIRLISKAVTAFRIGLTFFLLMVSWIFFRSDNITSACSFVSRLFSGTFFINPIPQLRAMGVLTQVICSGICIAALIALEWIQRDKKYALEFDGWPQCIRWPAYASVAAFIFLFRYTGESLDFIYFQF